MDGAGNRRCRHTWSDNIAGLGGSTPNGSAHSRRGGSGQPVSYGVALSSRPAVNLFDERRPRSIVWRDVCGLGEILPDAWDVERERVADGGPWQQGG
jgi:hypothetical protein